MYGTAIGQFNKSISTFSSHVMTSVGVFWSGKIWDGTFDGLLPGKQYHRSCLESYKYLGTTYYYYIQMGTLRTFVYSFTTVQSNPQVIRFAALADVGTFDNSRQTVSQLTKLVKQLNFVIHPGDISYAAGKNFHDHHPNFSNFFSDDQKTQCPEALSDEFARVIQPVSANLPYMVSPGNHEGYECDFQPYQSRWNMPNIQTGFWYSYDYGFVHMISISTEHPIGVDSPQYRWLVEDLASRKSTALFT